MKLVIIRHGESEWNKLNLFTGKRVLITAHGNSIRSLVKYFENLTEDQRLEVNIPTGIPLVYEFDDNFQVKDKYYLGNEKEINEKIKSVSNQGNITHKDIETV